MNNETKEYLIKLVASMAEWEYANGHDDMADRFRKVLPRLVMHGEAGYDTVLDNPQDMADMICQDYQDHIIEFYAEPYTKANPNRGEVTVVKDHGTDDLIEELERLITNDPS